MSRAGAAPVLLRAVCALVHPAERPTCVAAARVVVLGQKLYVAALGAGRLSSPRRGDLAQQLLSQLFFCRGRLLRPLRRPWTVL